MLIPLGTDRPARRRTRVTPVLIGLNLLVFATMAGLERVDVEAYQRVLTALWLDPAALTAWGFVTSCFVHGGALHIGMNMLFLWVFGPPIEDRLGRWWFTGFYLAGGAAACGLHVLFDRSPVVGASGAIAACTGAFVILFPRTRVLCLWLLGLSRTWVSAPWFVGFAVAMDLLLNVWGGWTGIAHLAHLGGYGFGGGVSLALLALRIIPSEDYDVFAMMRQAQRRRVIREAVREREAEVARRLDPAREAASAEAERALIDARAEVARLAARREWGAAMEAYVALVDRFAAAPPAHTTMTRAVQIELGNALFAAERHRHAAEAYERFAAAHPSDPESPRVLLMVALVSVRRLGDAGRGRRALERINGRLGTDDERALEASLRAEVAAAMPAGAPAA